MAGAVSTFFDLPLEGKFMEYEDGCRVSYQQHVAGIAAIVGAHPDGTTGASLEQNYLQCLAADTIKICQGQPTPEFDALAECWLRILDGAKRGERKGAPLQFYSNLAYDLGAILDTPGSCQSWRSHQAWALLHLHVSGINCRRGIGRGPRRLEYMPTPRLVDAARALSANPDAQVRVVAVNVLDELGAFGTDGKLTKVIENFNAACRRVGIDIRFEKTLIPVTGANAYNLGKGRAEAIARGLHLEFEAMHAMQDAYEALMIEYKVAAGMLDQDRSTFVRELVMWNVSEYVARIACVDPKCAFVADPFVEEVIIRCALGQFACASRVNQIVADSPLSKIYFLM